MKDGEVVPEGFAQMAKKIYGDDNEDAIAIADEIGSECAKTTHDDRCELAVLLMECAKAALDRRAVSSEEKE